MDSLLPSPAVSIVGRRNSGKTTLVEALISTLTKRGLDVGSIKHHGHANFDIDIPGKDSYRHRAAGAREVVISCPNQIATIRSVDQEIECTDLVARMPGHDMVIVEGYRKSGLPSIEIMREGNAVDKEVATVFLEDAKAGVSLDADFVQAGRTRTQAGRFVQAGPASVQDMTVPPKAQSLVSRADEKRPSARTIAVVTDIEQARQAADIYGIPAFTFDDIEGLADFVQERIARPRVSVVIQAGGESKRMGCSKATVSFAGRPLIEHMVERVLPVADELVITTNEPENLAFLEKAFPHIHIRLVTDILDYRGALPGLLTALTAATYSYVAVVACDMVYASPRLIAAECAEMNVTGADIVVPVNKHGFEPFHAVYRRDTCIDEVKRYSAEGGARMRGFFENLNVVEFPMARVLDVEPAGGCFTNVNTPEELAAVERNYLA